MEKSWLCMVSQIGDGHCLFKIEFLEKDGHHKLNRMESIIPLEVLARPEMGAWNRRGTGVPFLEAGLESEVKVSQ